MAINATTVEVTYKDAVKDVDAAKYSIEGLTVTNAAVKQTDSKTVILTTSTQEGAKEYTVKSGAVKVGTFKGISAVVPTSIKLVSTSAQSQVGKEVTLKADIGQKAAGVAVTFNVDASGSLNKDQVVEVYTNADGIASYSYTQYAAENDSVAVYPTGAPTVRAFATVYWGVDNILTIVEDKAGNTVANGTKKTYTVTYKDPKTGKGIANAELNVAFLENINVAFNALSTATVTDPQTGLTTTPYQALNGTKESIQIKTDSNGTATFIVSGTNTAVTPAVFVDGEKAALDNLDNGKWDANELTSVSAKTTFQGAQLTNVITVERDGEEEAAAGRNNGRAYKVKVVDKDGKAYANGLVQVGLDEEEDNIISTKSDARFADKDGIDKGQKTELRLDKDGMGTIYLYGADNTSGTPIIWIDQNTSENYQNKKLESGEPFNKGAVSNFQYERVIGGLLTLEGEEKDKSITDGTADYKFELTNQSGNALDRLQGKLTYEVRNTSGNPITVTAPNAIFKKADGTTLASNAKIEGYGSVTITADVSSVNASKLEIKSQNGSAVTAKVTPTFRTVDGFDASGDNGVEKDSRDSNKTVTTTGLTATIGAVDGIPSFAPSVIVDWANIGKNTLKLVNFDGTIDYSKAEFYVADHILKDSSAPGVPTYTKTTLADFEQYISESDTVTFTKGTDGAHVIRLELQGASDRNDGTKTPVVPVVKTIDAVKVTDGVEPVPAQPAKYTSAVIAGSNFPDFSFKVTSGSTVFIVNVQASDNAAQIADKINDLGGTAVTATTADGRVVITSKNVTDSVQVSESAILNVFNNSKSEPIAAVVAVKGKYNYRFADNIEDGDKVQVHGITYTAGTTNSGYTFNASGAIASDLTNLALSISYNDSALQATSASPVLTLTEKTNNEGKVEFKNITVSK